MARLSLGARRGEAGQWLVAVAKPRWHECSCYLRAPSPCARASLLSAYPMPMPTRAPATCVPHPHVHERPCYLHTPCPCRRVLLLPACPMPAGGLVDALSHSRWPWPTLSRHILGAPLRSSPSPHHRPHLTAPFAIASAPPPSPSPPHCPLRHRLRTAPFAIASALLPSPLSHRRFTCLSRVWRRSVRALCSPPLCSSYGG